MKTTYTLAVAACAFVLVSCTPSQSNSSGIYMLVDTSGTYREEIQKAQQIIRETLSDRYLQYLWIQTLNENPNVIYVATEANMPIFKGVAGRR